MCEVDTLIIPQTNTTAGLQYTTKVCRIFYQYNWFLFIMWQIYMNIQQTTILMWYFTMQYEACSYKM